MNIFKKKTLSPNDLAKSIVLASAKCTEVIKNEIDKKYGQDSKEAITKWMEVQYEFLFFFMHLAMRSAQSRLGFKNSNKLQNILYPIIKDTTTQIWFGHWPKKYQEGVKAKFIDDVNIAEIEYSKCKALIVKNQPYSDGLIQKLAFNVSKISGLKNFATVAISTDITLKLYIEMKLDQLIDSVNLEGNI